MRIATYTVRADARQAARWNVAAQSEGYESTGRWLAAAADAYLKVRARAGQPLPLAWRLGRFKVRLLDGAEPTLRGWIAEPFAFYRGDQAGPGYHGCHVYTLVYAPELRALGTFRYARHCKALAADLARSSLGSVDRISRLLGEPSGIYP